MPLNVALKTNKTLWILLKAESLCQIYVHVVKWVIIEYFHVANLQIQLTVKSTVKIIIIIIIITLHTPGRFNRLMCSYVRIREY